MGKSNKRNSGGGCGGLDTKPKGASAATTSVRKRKSTPRGATLQRSSSYRGVTRHRWTGRFEAHLWDKDCWNQTQSKRGKQVYLGAYDDEEAAAHAYDLAALKYWGHETILNFPLSTYQEELKEMAGQSREEYIGSLRRKSSGFSRGVSKYRGVARHHHNGRWEARIGRVFGNKYLYLGTYATQEEAAMAYDMAAIEYRGLNAVTNFNISRYNVNLLQRTAASNDIVTATATIDVVNPSSESINNSSELQGTRQVAPRDATKVEEATDSTSTTTSEEHASSTSLPMQQQEAPMHAHADAAAAPQYCSFPDDIQTFFECQITEDITAEDDIFFGGLEFLPCATFHLEHA